MTSATPSPVHGILATRPCPGAETGAIKRTAAPRNPGLLSGLALREPTAVPVPVNFTAVCREEPERLTWPGPRHVQGVAPRPLGHCRVGGLVTVEGRVAEDVFRPLTSRPQRVARDWQIFVARRGGVVENHRRLRFCHTDTPGAGRLEWLTVHDGQE